MNKEKMMKLTIVAIVFLTTIVLLLSLKFKLNEISIAENNYGKQDLTIRNIKDINNLAYKDISTYTVYNYYPEIEYKFINGKKVYGVELMDIDKNYFQMMSYSYDSSIVKDGNIIISEGLAKYLNVKVGDKIKLDTDKNSEIYIVSGTVNNKMYINDSDIVYRIKKHINIGERTFFSAVLKDIHVEKEYITKLDKKYKIDYNVPLMNAKKNYLNIKDRFMFVIFSMIILSLSIFVLNVIYNREEKYIIGTKRIIGGDIIYLKKDYCNTYKKLSTIYVGVTIIVSYIISELINSLLFKSVRISLIDIATIVVMYICFVALILLIELFYSRNILSTPPIDIIKETNSKEERMFKISNIRYINLKSRYNVFWKYYQRDLIKNLLIIIIISVSASYIFKTNYTNYLDKVVYQQYKKFEGNDYDFDININGRINTNEGIESSIYDSISSNRDIEQIKGSRYSYGLVKLDPKIEYDKKYFEEVSKVSGYYRSVLKGVYFRDGGNTYLKSEILGVDNTYINEMQRYTIQGEITQNNMKKNSIILYIPKLENDKKPKVNYKVGEYVDLYIPQDGSSDESYFGANKIDKRFYIGKFRIVAIVEKPPIVSEYYAGDLSIIPVMHIDNLNRITKTNIYRDVKVKFKSNLTDGQKRLYFEELYKKSNRPGMSFISYLDERKSDFENIDNGIKLKNMIAIFVIFLTLSISSINSFINIKKRENELRLLHFIGLSLKKIRGFMFIENFLNYICSSILFMILSLNDRSMIVKEYADTLLDKNIDSGFKMLLIIAILVIIVGAINIRVFTHISLKRMWNKDL